MWLKRENIQWIIKIIDYLLVYAQNGFGYTFNDYRHSTIMKNIHGILNYFQTIEPDAVSEVWRRSVETQIAQYVNNHYPHGVCSVFGRAQGSTVTLYCCIEDHQFQPKNFWLGYIYVYFNPFEDCLKIYYCWKLSNSRFGAIYFEQSFYKVQVLNEKSSSICLVIGFFKIYILYLQKYLLMYSLRNSNLFSCSCTVDVKMVMFEVFYFISFRPLKYIIYTYGIILYVAWLVLSLSDNQFSDFDCEISDKV